MAKVKLYSHLGSDGSIGLNARSTIQIRPGLRWSMVLPSGTVCSNLAFWETVWVLGMAGTSGTAAAIPGIS